MKGFSTISLIKIIALSGHRVDGLLHTDRGEIKIPLVFMEVLRFKSWLKFRLKQGGMWRTCQLLLTPLTRTVNRYSLKYQPGKGLSWHIGPLLINWNECPPVPVIDVLYHKFGF